MAYRILERGLEWQTSDGKTVRAEPGELRDDLIAADVPELLEAGLIVDEGGAKTKAARPKAAKEAKKK